MQEAVIGTEFRDGKISALLFDANNAGRRQDAFLALRRKKQVDAGSQSRSLAVEFLRAGETLEHALRRIEES